MVGPVVYLINGVFIHLLRNIAVPSGVLTYFKLSANFDKLGKRDFKWGRDLLSISIDIKISGLA